MSRRAPRAAVLLATAALPRGVRARWREELLADLASLPPQEQARFARGVLLHAAALRWATAGVAPERFTASPWSCRLRLHHRLATFSADDGSRYLRCTRCGLDRGPARDGHPLVGYELMRVF